jgi:hypothetical protein
METAIDYLSQVHGDLLDAAARERADFRPVPARGPRRRVPLGGLVAASVAVLMIAGVIGAGILGGGSGEEATAPGSAGETGAAATGATGVPRGLERSPAVLPAPGAADEFTGSAGGAGVAPQDEAPVPDATRVIRTAELSLVIPGDSFDERFGEVVDAAEANGGFVADSSSRERAGNLTVRVPAENFDETLRALRGLGDVRLESVRGKDVTAEYVDLRARLRISRARLEVLLGLMADASSIEQTIRVQNALDETQLRIEQIQGQLRLLDDRVSLATITVELREQGVEPEAEVETPSIPNAFERAIAGAVGVVAAIVIGLGYLLPLLVLGGVVWLIASRVRRRRAKA